MTTRRTLALGAALLVVIVVAGAVVAALRHPPRWPGPVRAANAAGDTACLSCHRDKGTFETTAHRLTTRMPSESSIHGDFTPPGNVLRTSNPYVHFRMARDSSGWYETAVTGAPPDTTTRTEKIADVAGSGRKGQSYLYWANGRLYQLPISYWRNVGWINSPGNAYVDGRVNFDRQIAPRCMDCHSTWIDWVPDPGTANRYRPEGAILGITCERCHGSGAAHVASERSVLRAVRTAPMVNPAKLTRERQIETCAQCHGGLGSPIATFSYVPGQPLRDYLVLSNVSDGRVDVHGNQVALLARSRCFQSSQMTCLTCHDVHRTQRDPAELSGKCLTCHQLQSCGLFPKEGNKLAGRCVDCHMPVQPSNLIVSSLQKTQERAMVRNHWIRVYEDSVTSAAVHEKPATNR